jgi:histidinol-phosphate phosphatase family protein
VGIHRRRVLTTSGAGASRAIVFVDRDGVINTLVADERSGKHESPYTPRDVSLAPNASDALTALKAAGAALVLVSNQPAAAKGTCSLEALRTVHAEIVSQLYAAGAPAFDGVEYCFHHPEGPVAELSGSCDCRKPAPGMLVRGAERLGLLLEGAWIIGDSDVDILAGQAVGVSTVLVEEPLSRHRRTQAVVPDFRVPSLVEAARLIVTTFESEKSPVR